MADKANIECILPLTDQQASLWFYSSQSGDSDLGFLQVKFQLRGTLEVPIWKEAWETVIGRHESLRCSIHAPKDKSAMAICWKKVEMPWHYEDVISKPESERTTYIERFSEDDRLRGLSLGQAPVMRLSTFATGEKTHQVFWCCHHLFLDGWSSTTVLKEVMSCYHSLLNHVSPTHPKSTSLRRYHNFLKSRDIRESIGYWANQFKDKQGTFLGQSRKQSAAPHWKTQALQFSTTETNLIEKTIESYGLTIGSLTQAVWAHLLSQITGNNQVTFGTTVSGRNCGFEGVENLVGFLSNTLPIQQSIPNGISVKDWIHTIRREQFEGQLFEDISLAKMIENNVLKRVPFDTLLLVENLPDIDQDADHTLHLHDYSSAAISVYPITMVVLPVEDWRLEITFDENRFNRDGIQELLQSFKKALLCIAQKPEQQILLFTRATKVPEFQFLSKSGLIRQKNEVRNDAFKLHPIELRLINIWEEALGCRISPGDHFFDNGGDSITSSLVIQRINEHFDISLPTESILQYPTIRQLRKALEEKEAVQMRCILPIQPRSSGIPVFCIHDRNGLVMTYRRLAEYVTDSPFYCIKPIGFEDDPEPFESFESMATHYLKEIKKIHPQGPYALVGYCASGPVAFELAQQIQQSGDSVALLALVDPSVPEGNLIPHSTSLPKRVKRTYLIQGGTPKAVLKMLSHAVYFRIKQLMGRFATGGPDNLALRPSAFLKAFDKAYEDYEPKRYSDSILFIQSRQTRVWDEVYLKNGYADYWRDRAKDFEVVDIDCLHPHMMDEPFVQKVGDSINRKLREQDTL